MFKGEPAVSVLMAVHNGERYLRSAIESVLGQTRDDLEFLIVDDGSTDDTPKILAEYARDDARIIIHRISQVGRSAALNSGCRRARAELIARLDADDVSLPERLERQLRFLEANEEVALLGGGALLIDEQGKVFGKDRARTSDSEIRKTLEGACPFYHSNVVFRRRAVEAVGGYRTVFEPAEDYDLWLRLAERHGLANLWEFVGKYRFHPQQESVRLVEAQAIVTVAARVSARERREGRGDPFDTVERIDADMLIAMGVDRRDLIQSVVRYALWYAEHLSRAGQEGAASSLWDLAVARAHSPSAPPSLQDELCRRNRTAWLAASDPR
jgi:glycosyltransferase involved in cell wall biosynthesis